MKTFRFAFISLLVLFILTPSANGQVAVDSAYIKYINSAWDELRKTKDNDALETKYASEFYDYYIDHQETEAGKKAIQSALLMWGNTGNADMVDQAITNFDYNSELWERVAHSIGNAYARDSSRTLNEAINKLQLLKDKVTHPEGKSSIITSLIRYNKRKVKDQEQLIPLAQELINIDANPWYVDFGLGVIYEIESLGLGQPAPEFTAVSYSNEEIALNDYKGKYIILDFWATWCGPCIPELPVIKSLHEKYSEKDLIIISVALEEASEKFDDFLKEHKIDWTQIIQDEQWKDEIPTMYNVRGIPQKYVIGPEGNIVVKNLRGEKLVAKMDSLINQN